MPEASAGSVVSSAKPLDIAGPEDLTFYEDPAYAAALSFSDAGACFVTAKLANSVPAHIVRLIVDKPYAAFVKAARALFPDDLRPLSNHQGRAASIRKRPYTRKPVSRTASWSIRVR